MNTKSSIHSIFTRLLLLLALFTIASCSDWTDQEGLDIDRQNAKEQNPELWARYMEVLRSYKQSKHFVTYARFDNGAEQSKNEGAYLRSLPDSLDIVTPSNPEKFTSYDYEDILLLQEKSTKVLYLVDYATQMSTLTDAGKLGAWLDKAVAAASQIGMDGFAFTGTPLYGGTEAEQTARKEAARLIVSKLSATGKMLVFEGDPAFLDAADLSKLNYLVLNTANIENAVTLKLQVTNMLSTYALPKDKLLLAAKINAKLTDENLKKLDAVTEMPNRVVSLGPLAGIAIYSIGDDYYHSSMYYRASRTAIQIMNPSK